MPPVTLQEYFSQADILSILRCEGYNISLRTLRYWRSTGLIPQLYNYGYSGLGYPVEVIDNIRRLCDSAGRLLGDVIAVKYLEGECFKIYAYFITKLDNVYHLQVYTDKGILIEERSNLDGLDR